MQGSRSASSWSNLTSPLPPNHTSAKASRISAEYDAEREARLDLLKDEIFVGRLEETLKKIIEPVVERLLKEHLTESRRQSPITDRSTIGSAEVLNYQKYLIAILNQHRLELYRFGSNVVQQMGVLRQEIYQSQSAMNMFAFGDVSAGENSTQTQQTFLDPNAGFNGI